MFNHDPNKQSVQIGTDGEEHFVMKTVSAPGQAGLAADGGHCGVCTSEATLLVHFATFMASQGSTLLVLNRCLLSMRRSKRSRPHVGCRPPLCPGAAGKGWRGGVQQLWSHFECPAPQLVWVRSTRVRLRGRYMIFCHGPAEFVCRQSTVCIQELCVFPNNPPPVQR